MGANQGLNEYLQILRSPDIYPDIAGAGFLMSPIIAVVSTIIALLGMVALLFVLLRIGADVLVMSGAMSMVEGRSAGQKVIGLSSFKGADLGKYVGNPLAYIRDFAWKIILMLAFIGLMISGHILPLAGTVTAATGAIISKVSDINPVPYIDALEINNESATQLVSRSTLATMMKEYNKHVGNMVSSKQQADKMDKLSVDEHHQAAVAYYNSYYSAMLYSANLQQKLKDIRESSETDRTLSREEEELRNFNYNSYNKDVDRVLLEIAVSSTGSSGYKGDESLKATAESAIKSLRDGR